MAADFTEKTLTRTPDFQQAAQPAAVIEPPKVMVSMQLDVDLVAFFQSDTEPSDWQRHINDLLRYYMETSRRPGAHHPRLSSDRDCAAGRRC